MSLNIKNQRVHDLAREAARITGKSQTSVIEEALERLLADYGVDRERERINRTIDDVKRLAADYRADMTRVNDEILTIEDLYDEATGLPR
jgi:antitoxin VapB